MSKATGRLSDVLAALRLLAPVAGLLPFGDKLIAGVNIAINLCEAAQTAKSNESAYEDLSSRCTSLLLSVATCLRTADPNKRPIMIKDMEALVQTLTEVHQAAAKAIVQHFETSTKPRMATRLLKSAKDMAMARAKKEKEEIQRLQEKITIMFAKFELESHMRLEISTQSIADIIVDVRQEQEAQRKQIVQIQKIQAAAVRDADNALLNQLDPVHAALHDSDTLEVSTCLENTRVELLAKLDEWRDSTDGPPFFWLNGLAGTGKSTIARSFCQRVPSNGAAPVLLASFFISRQSVDRRSAVSIVHTIAYQLALQREGIRLAVCRAMRDQADLTRRPLREQVSKLVSAPLNELRPADRLMIVIDALDECDKDAKGREGGDLIPLLCAAFYTAASSVKLLVTSRLESTIQTTFEEVKQATSAQVVLKLHDIDHDVVRGDLRRYLVHSLRRVATRVQGLRDSVWPSDAVIELLVERAGVLFIWAATVVRFVDSHPFNPRCRLDQVLSATRDPSSSPYWKLDELYLQVLSQAVDVGVAPRQDADALVQCLRTVAGTVILLQRQLPPDALASLTGLDSLEARSMLERLSSVLIISDDEPVRALHPSFADFLTDSARCTDSRFLILEPVHHAAIVEHSLSILNGHLKRDICSLGNFQVYTGYPIPDLDERVARCIPKELGYACCYWFDHLDKSSDNPAILGEVEVFARSHILHWIECMSLLAEMETAVSGVARALGWCQVRLQATNSNTAPDLVISIINDTLSLLGEYYDPIRIAPLAVYQSALLFMPCCALYVVACDDLQDVRLLSPRKPIWTSDTLIFQRECYGNLLPIAVSPDDSVVAAVNWNQPYVGVGVTVWKTSTGQVLNTWSSNTPHVVLVQAIAFSLDGKQLAIITLDSPRVHWWEPHTGMCRIQPIDLKISSGFRDSKYGRVPSHSVISEGGSRLVVGFSHGIDDVSLQAVDLDTGETRVLLCDLAVTSVAVSQDASRIASSSDDGSLRVWNAHDGILLSILNGFGRPAVVLAFTPRHNIVAMTNDGAVRIGGVESGGLVFVLRDSEDSVEITGKISRAALYSGYYNANAISASARSPLVAVATSKFVSVWNEETRQRVAQRQLYTSPSKEYTVNSAVAFMSHRPGLIVAPSQEAMSLWNFQTQWQTAEAPPFDMLGGAVNSVKFSHEGCFVISGSDDPDLRIWETSSGVLTATIRTGHTHPVIGAAFALRDRSLVLSGSDGGQDMELREVRASGLLKRLDASSRWQYTYQLIAFSRDGSQFATMTRETGWNPVLCKVLRLYESNTGKVLAEERLGESVEFTEISFLPNGSRIIAICSSFMKSWSTLKQSPLCDSRTTKAEEPRRDSFLSFACSPDSARIVSISPNCNIHVWDAHTDEKIRSTSYESLDIETSPPVIWLCAQYVVHYSPTTSGRFLSCSWAGVVRIWNDDTLDMENIFTAVDLSPNSRSFHTVYSMITACYSPDGATVAVAVEHFLRTFSRYLEVRVHDTSTGQTIKSLVPITRHPVHEDPGFKSDLEAPDIPRILSLNFSPDGQYVFSLRGGCHRVEVWSVISGEHMGSLPSPLRTCWAALSVCPITARLFVTCNPKSIAQRVAEAAEVSAELVAQSGLVGDDATNMCLSIVQDLFEADQTYLCVWDTHSFHLQSTLRCGNDGLGLPHFCIDQDSRSLLRKPLPRYHTIPIVRQIPRLYRPRFALSPDGWITFISSPDRWVAFILKPDGWSTRHYDVENGEDKDVRMSIRVCNIPPNRRPPTNLLLRSHNCTWGPVASHGHIVAIGSLKGLVSIIDLTSLMLKLERKINLQQPGRDQR